MSSLAAIIELCRRTTLPGKAGVSTPIWMGQAGWSGIIRFGTMPRRVSSRTAFGGRAGVRFPAFNHFLGLSNDFFPLLTNPFPNSYLSVALKAFNGTLARTLFAQYIVRMIRTCPTRTMGICASRQIRGLSCLRPKDGQVDQGMISTKLKRRMRGWRSSLATSAKSNLRAAFRSSIFLADCKLQSRYAELVKVSSCVRVRVLY